MGVEHVCFDFGTDCVASTKKKKRREVDGLKKALAVWTRTAALPKSFATLELKWPEMAQYSHSV